LWLGKAFLQIGRLDQAEQSLKKANELFQGKSAEVHWQLARIYNEQKRYREAADELELFLKYQPDSRDAEKIKQVIKRLRQKSSATEEPSNQQ
jgi:tetratricopeptide (TPR) repeat protein